MAKKVALYKLKNHHTSTASVGVNECQGQIEHKPKEENNPTEEVQATASNQNDVNIKRDTVIRYCSVEKTAEESSKTSGKKSGIIQIQEAPLDLSRASVSANRIVADVHLNALKSSAARLTFQCNTCDQSFDDKSDLEKHSQACALFRKNNSTCDLKSSCDSQKNKYEEQKLFKCDSDSSLTTTKSDLTPLGKNVSAEKPFQCEHCSSSFEREEDLISHQITHTVVDEPYKCTHCHFSCSKKDHLTTHIRTHTGEKPYQCSVCSYASAQKCHLDIHIRTHTDEKPYKCTHCGVSFSAKGNLTRHIRTHTEKKLFKCSECSFASALRGDLTNHIQTHTGEKPYQCSECSYASTQKSNLKIHIRSHTGEKPYKCTFCRFSFSTKGYLTKHIIQMHTEEKP